MSSTRRTRTHSLPTLAVHAGEPAHDADTPVVTPLQQSVSFVHEMGTSDGVREPGYGNASNAEVVQKKLAALERAEAGVVLSSGMGATACALMALLRPGDHLLASRDLYGGTRRLITEEFTTLGIDVTLVDPFEARGWRKRMRKETRAVFLESPMNPTCRVIDLRPLSYLTHESGLALVVDSTYASPVNFRPLEHGADVVIHSTTKFLNGHHDMMGGAVLGTASYVEEVRQKMIVWGQAPDPFACWLLERGLKTLDVRVRRQNENALQIAQWCDDRREIRAVHYPGLSTHPDHEVAAEQMNGFGGMLAFDLGSLEAARRLLNTVRLCALAESLGGVETLISHPATMTHAAVPAERRAALGISDGLVRLSVGIEDLDDLKADLTQALDQV